MVTNEPSPTAIEARPLTPACVAAFDARAHACFGMSPGNSYFNFERVRELLRWAIEEFDRIHVWIPDTPTAFTLEAIGYDPRRAAQKARKQSRCLRNRVVRAIEAIGGHDPDAMIVTWSDVQDHPAYVRRYRDAVTAFEEDPVFRHACLEMSRVVVEKHAKPGVAISEQRLALAARYVLAEVPFFVDAATIVGAPASVFCYHRPEPFHDGLFGGRYTVRPASNQGYVIAAPSAHAPVAA